jgi:nicotinate-nucleotide--dimethylbenzimidazole phosphoribosyltransferase
MSADVTPSPEAPMGFADIDAFLFDIGDTLVSEAPPGTPVAELRAKLRPGVLKTLRGLAEHHRLGAVTNTSTMREADVRELLEPAGLNGLLEVVVTSVDVGAAKPDPTSLNEALRRLGAAPERTVYVGDAPGDQLAAASAGVRFLAVDRGIADAIERLRGSRSGAFAEACRCVRPLDEGAASAARAHQDRLTKPPGSLGRLEDLGVQLAAIAGRCPPPQPRPAAVAVFAGDHGVVEAGVTPWPQEVTAQMVANFAAGGAGINVIAREVGASVHIVDVGVAADLSDLEGVIQRKVRPGTADLSSGPAMTVAEARAALDVGTSIAAELVAEGNRLLVMGDMGIGNTTASAALISAFTGTEASAVTGRGTGIDDEMLARKASIVESAADRTRGWLDPTSILSELGGLEIAALAGFIVGGVAEGVPVLIDGVIAAAALLAANAMAPGAAARCIAGHRSTEPGGTVALEHLNLVPVLDLALRLGEGTGGCLAITILQAAASVLRGMATFDQAAISERHAEGDDLS